MAVRLGVEPRTSRYTLQHVSWVSHNNNTYPWSSPKNHVITAECSNQLSYQTNGVGPIARLLLAKQPSYLTKGG